MPGGYLGTRFCGIKKGGTHKTASSSSASSSSGGKPKEKFFLPEITVWNSHIGGDTLWMWVQNLANITATPAIMIDIKELSGRLSVAYFTMLTPEQKLMQKWINRQKDIRSVIITSLTTRASGAVGSSKGASLLMSTLPVDFQTTDGGITTANFPEDQYKFHILNLPAGEARSQTANYNGSLNAIDYAVTQWNASTERMWRAMTTFVAGVVLDMDNYTGQALVSSAMSLKLNNKTIKKSIEHLH